MMQELFNSVLSGVALCFIWWLWFFEYRRMRINISRQKLFNLRDELFYWVASHDRALFDSEAYHVLRDTLNGMIRFTHKFSFFRLLWIIYFHTRIANNALAKEFQDNYSEAMQRLSETARTRFEEAHLGMHVIILKHVVFSSFILCSAYYLMRAARKAQAVTKTLLFSQVYKQKWFAIDAEAFKEANPSKDRIKMATA